MSAPLLPPIPRGKDREPSASVSAEGAPGVSPTPAFREAMLFWLKLGFISFGGPTGQIAVMHEELVTKRRWIGEGRFLHALNYCMLLPGPEAQQLATYIGWLLHGTPGGLVAGILFVLPGALVMFALSWIYVVHGSVPLVAAVFYGLRAAVIAIVAAAVIRIGSRAFKHPAMVALAAAAFAAIFFFHGSFPAIVVAAGLTGALLQRVRPEIFAGATPTTQATAESLAEAGVVGDRIDAPVSNAGTIAQATATRIGTDEPLAGAGVAGMAPPTLPRTLGVLALGLALWWGPLAAVIAWRGMADVVSQEAVFFSKASMVTFGGAYAVLPYISQAAVETYGWLEPREMLDGLALAETTPGPLIMVTQFVGFTAAYREPGDLPPLAAASLGAAVTTWATFAPSILWIFLGAPYVERLRHHRALGAALSSITAAVVGVVLNLAVWFGLQSFFATVSVVHVAGADIPVPGLTTLDPFALAIAAIAFVGMQRFRWGIIPVILGSAAAGLVAKLIR